MSEEKSPNEITPVAENEVWESTGQTAQRPKSPHESSAADSSPDLAANQTSAAAEESRNDQSPEVDQSSPNESPEGLSEQAATGDQPAVTDEPSVGAPLNSSDQPADPLASNTSETTADPSVGTSQAQVPTKPAGGPINLERIRQLRKSQEKSAPIRRRRTEKSPGQQTSQAAGKPQAQPPSSGSQADHSPMAKQKKPVEEGIVKTPEPPKQRSKVAVPSVRAGLSADMEDELTAALGETGNLDSLLVGDSSVQVGKAIAEGQRLQGKIMKTHGEHVFVSLGGPNEGVVPALQFAELPEPGTLIEVVVRGYLADEGLYELTVPGSSVEVNDWDDLREGEVIEVLVTGSNSGGLECKVGSLRGFIPASQVAEFRVENFGEFVDQKVLCVITEANPRRGNLVLSRRAVLEREKKEKREERLAALQVGDAVDGTVRKLTDFGAFVDIGGLDGLLHISQLSWERVNHPSEILEEGQKIQVRIEKIDPQTGKIGLSYRSLQEHPWNNAGERFPVGSVIKGTVTRIAEFGAFVKIATGVEGLVHVSELAHHRVHRVSNVVQEGQEVDVKILSVDEENQRISLSIKGAQAAPAEETDTAESTEEEQPVKPVLPKRTGPLKGGTSRPSGGEQFGLKW